jgi:hypothetical protein
MMWMYHDKPHQPSHNNKGERVVRKKSIMGVFKATKHSPDAGFP